MRGNARRSKPCRRANLTFWQRLINTGLQPGDERTLAVRAVSTAWPGSLAAVCRKRLKPFRFLPAANTRLKPGVNGTRIQLQETEMRPYQCFFHFPALLIHHSLL